MDYKHAAQQALDCIGGKDNIVSAAHCATRLRLVIADNAKVNKQELENAEGAKGVFEAQGQLQIIFGTGTVNKVYDEFIQLAGIEGGSKEDVKQAAAAKAPWYQRAIKTLGDIFVPIIPAIVASGFLMGIMEALNFMVNNGYQNVDTTGGSGCTIDETIAIEAVIENGVDCGPRAYLRPGTHMLAGSKADGKDKDDGGGARDSGAHAADPSKAAGYAPPVSAPPGPDGSAIPSPDGASTAGTAPGGEGGDGGRGVAGRDGSDGAGGEGRTGASGSPGSPGVPGPAGMPGPDAAPAPPVSPQSPSGPVLA